MIFKREHYTKWSRKKAIVLKELEKKKNAKMHAVDVDDCGTIAFFGIYWDWWWK